MRHRDVDEISRDFHIEVFESKKSRYFLRIYNQYFFISNSDQKGGSIIIKTGIVEQEM